MRRLALLLVAALAATALGPAGQGQPAPVAAQLYLSSLQATLPGVGTVETLTPNPPVKADDSVRNATTGAAWYLLPGTLPGLAGEATVSGQVQGTVHLLLTPVSPLPLGVTLTNTVRVELRRVTANGTEERLGNTTQEFQLTLTPPVSNSTAVNWTISPSNASLLAGESLALNVTATSQPPLGTLAVQYDSTARPSGFNITFQPLARGDILLSASTASRDVAPGASATYFVSVRNNADQQDTVRLNTTGSPSDWQVGVNPSSLALTPGSTGSVLVTVRAPPNASDGARHTATLTALSALGANQSLALTTTVRVQQVCMVAGQQDQDCDGFSDVDERRYSSRANDPTSTPDNTDTDGDGASNKAEVDAQTDPLDPDDFPGAGDRAPPGGAGGASPLAPLSDPIAEALGVDSSTADVIALGLILLFLLILLLLLFLLLGGYPVKLSLVEARAATEPGRSADYSVEVRSRTRKGQTVDLEVAELPEDWEARFNRPRLELPPKARETVGMLVRPPDNWPAPSKREFQVRARSRLKPAKFARAVAKLLIQPAPAVQPPEEEGVPEQAWEPAPPPPEPVAGAAAFRVGIRDVRHDPPAPERGGEVTTKARIDNEGAAQERLRVVLVVNDKVRDEVRVELGPGEGAEAEFRWVAHLARNEVKVVAERA